MKILFLCGSLVPGYDGVGDYTRSLGAALIDLGHTVLCISLNESGSLETLGRTGVEDGFLRLSGAMPWQERMVRAEQAIRDFDPDWVSLQFVPYSFHPKGLVSALVNRLVPLFADRCGHLMFHELWIGESTEYGLKDRVVGFLQKSAVLRLVRQWRPKLIHTSNPVYRELLRRNGVFALELPLPGNIPVAAPETGGLVAVVGGPEWSSAAFVRGDWWVAGVFGTIHPQWSPEGFLDPLCALARKKKKRLLLLHLGRTPAPGAAVWTRLAEDYAGRCDFIALGPLSPARLSVLFQALDFGIATSPWALIGKSGSAAAMLDHGLPLVVTRDDWRLRSGSTPEPTPQPLLFASGAAFLAHLEVGGPRASAQSRWPSIAEQFVADLRRCESLPVHLRARAAR